MTLQVRIENNDVRDNIAARITTLFKEGGERVAGEPDSMLRAGESILKTVHSGTVIQVTEHDFNEGQDRKEETAEGAGPAFADSSDVGTESAAEVADEADVETNKENA